MGERTRLGQMRRCRFCFRPLKGAASRHLGAGPACARAMRRVLESEGLLPPARERGLSEFDLAERQGQMRFEFPDRADPVCTEGGTYGSDRQE